MAVKKFGKFAQPGRRTTGDRTRNSRRIGWEYVHTIIDDCSRTAYSESTTTASPDRDRFAKSFVTGRRRIPCNYRSGRYWARTSDLRLVEAALSQLS